MSAAIDVLDSVDLTEIGNVPLEYRHARRLATPGEPLVLPGAVFKWYEVRPFGWEVPAEVDTQARRIVGAEAETMLADGYGLGFVVLHYSTTGYYLLAETWHGHQEMWRTVFVRTLDDADEFRVFAPAPNGPTGCVWELGPICHEKEAWTRYLFSARGVDAKRAYLDDTFSGEV
jgi:hypothetical protein